MIRPDAQYAMKRRLGLDCDEVDPVVQLGVAGGENLESLAKEVQSRTAKVLNPMEERNR
ncbi:MAG: hypothetical protein ACQET1_00805 [Gemmatimonadota bacterium]